MNFNPTASATQDIPAAGGAIAGVASAQNGYRITEELAENVSFAALATVANSRDMQIQQYMQNQGGGMQYTPPILFYPDGTSTSTRVTLANKRQRDVIVQLRGLSGVAEVSDVLTVAELPP